jgi:ABC-type phosphate/phosphonate transport system substrate-binding protein
VGRTASLPMYDLEEVRDATDVLWRSIAKWLRAAGIPAPDDLDRPDDLHGAWTSTDLLLSQTCGYPLVTSLRGQVELLGAFSYAVGSASGPTYRSVLVVPSGAELPADPTRATAAVNAPASLSGWVSLGAAFGGVAWPGSIVPTGSHVESLRAVRERRADVAAIDGVTFALLARHRPDVVAGVAVVGEGPTIPTLPLVTRVGGPVAERAALRGAIAAALAEPATAAARDALGITGFVAVGPEHYEAVLDLVPELRGRDRGDDGVSPARTRR